MSAKQVFVILEKFPIEKEVIRYPTQKSNKEQHPYHDILTANLEQLVPNINIGLQMNMEPSQLMDWIETAKEYSNQLNIGFHKQCEKRMKQIIQIEEQKQRSRDLDMNKVNLLPEDIIHNIYNYLLPETKIQLFRSRYPNLIDNIKRLKVTPLKKLMEHIRRKYYEPMMRNLHKYNRARCLPKDFFMSFSYCNKPNSMGKIRKFMGTCETAVPYTKSEHNYFQRKVLRLMKSIIYVAGKKRVLDKPESESESESESKVKKIKKNINKSLKAVPSENA